MKYSAAVMIRIINILLNVGSGIILAQTLSLNDRGEVAVIVSATGLAIILYSAVYSERILKRKPSNFNIEIQKMEVNFTRILITCTLALLLIQNTIEQIPLFLVIMSLFMIILGNLNTLLNSIIHNKVNLVVNQMFLVGLTIMYFSFLLLYSIYFDNTVTSWIIILNLSNFCTLISFIFYLKFKKIRIKILKNSNIERIWFSGKLKIENLAVYSAAMSQQILIIGISQFFNSDYLANIVILLSLFSIIGIPLVPILPNLIASPIIYLERLVKSGLKEIFRNIIVVSVFAIIISLIIQIFFPYMYGAKYSQLAETVPIVVLSAIGLSVSQYFSWLSRGLGVFGLSATVNLAPLLIIFLSFFILTFSVNTLFLFMAINYFVVSIFAYIVLKRKYFNLDFRDYSK